MIDMRPRTRSIPPYARRPIQQPTAPRPTQAAIRQPTTRQATLPRAARPKRSISWKIKVAVLAIFSVVCYVGLTSHRTVSRSAGQVAAVTHKPQTICLDPGHGGADPGANNHNTSERDINLTVALQVRTILQTKGYQVFMTRTTNTPNLPNIDRYTVCNNKHTTILVSIHHNFFTDPTVDHDVALYFKPGDATLATSIVDATSAKLGLLNNGVASFEDGVLSKSTMPAALSEGFFVTSSKEYAALVAPGSTRLADEATGIATGIINYFTNPPSAPAPAGPEKQIIDQVE
jgi:N-acetylmuramoyl-L-alanine amidase